MFSKTSGGTLTFIMLYSSIFKLFYFVTLSITETV